MRGIKFTLSAGATLLLAALYFLDNTGVFSAMLPAILAHELGHALALRASGARITRLHLGFAGLSMDYVGDLDFVANAFCSLAGPITGLSYAALCSILGNLLHSDFLLCSAGVSLVLTVFNLLPAPMLDGGRVFCRAIPTQVSYIIGIIIGAVLFLAGLFCLRIGYGAAPLSSGVWIIICTCKWRADVIDY